MQEDLESMGPLLEEAARDTEVTMQQIKVGGRHTYRSEGLVLGLLHKLHQMRLCKKCTCLS